jgi:hypothetical protein
MVDITMIIYIKNKTLDIIETKNTYKKDWIFIKKISKMEILKLSDIIKNLL